MGLSRLWGWIPEFTFATTGSTDEMYGETKSKSILEKQQMTSRITSVGPVASKNKMSFRTPTRWNGTNEHGVRLLRGGTYRTKPVLPVAGR